MKKTPLDITPREEIVLVALSRKPSYGVELSNELLDLSDEIDFGWGTLYPILHRLEREKMLRRITVQDFEPNRGGRAKKYYEITEHGIETLKRIRDIRLRLQEWSYGEYQVL